MLQSEFVFYILHLHYLSQIFVSGGSLSIALDEFVCIRI
jgi:hypothetical protein